MNNQTFQYSLLRYRHSYLLAEEVNVGILFYFPSVDRVEFLYPKYLRRISSLYPDISLTGLRKYLKAFDHKAQNINKRLRGDAELFEVSDLQTIIDEHFLRKDSTALLFSDIKKGVYENVNQTISYYRDQYLSVYDNPTIRDNKDERYIIKEVEKGLQTAALNFSDDIKQNYTVKTPYLSQTFDYAWQNGQTNLITPIGLDLQQKETIERKACTWRGRLDTLQETARENGLKFDLIVSRPAEKHLFKTYDNVLKILEDNKAPKEIIEVDQVNQYIKRVSEYLSNV